MLMTLWPSTALAVVLVGVLSKVGRAQQGAFLSISSVTDDAGPNAGWQKIVAKTG